MPSDQMSDFPSYCPSSMARMTSGAIQYGVPTKELAGDMNEAEPKSAVTKSVRHWCWSQLTKNKTITNN